VRLVVFSLIAALGPVHDFSFAFSARGSAGFWVTGSFIAMVGIEFAFYHMFRLAKRGSYPSLLAIELGASRDFDAACERAVRSVVSLLKAEGAGLAWIDHEEIGTFHPRFRTSVGWKDGADHWQRQNDLVAEAMETGRVGTARVAGCSGRARRLTCLPLLSPSRVVGVLGMVGSTRNADLRDKSLLTAIGVAVGLALDLLHYEMDLEEMARRDELTQLFNRRYFFQRLRKELDIAQELQRPLALLVLDVDGLKQINDTYGHAAGDQILAKVGHLLGQSIRGEDMAARIGGDEFAILMPDTDRRGALATARRIERALESKAIVVAEEGRLDIRVSLGVAGYPWSATDLTQIMHCADIQMYADKARHKAAAASCTPDALRQS
jgi:diguanylate cyclase (GGDEF)-like protein